MSLCIRREPASLPEHEIPASRCFTGTLYDLDHLASRIAGLAAGIRAANEGLRDGAAYDDRFDAIEAAGSTIQDLAKEIERRI